jgi:uncharacterized protein YdhG (YjbR/CyaY superfamily)
VTTAPSSVADYLTGLDAPVRAAVEQAWAAVQAGVPGADEAIAYGIPTLKVDGRSVVHVGGWASHVAIYPVPGDDGLSAELGRYRHGKGTLRFPLGEPLPVGLITRVAQALAARA